MSKGLNQLTPYERKKAIKRRLEMSEAMRGLGYWAAVDAQERMKEDKQDEDSS